MALHGPDGHSSRGQQAVQIRLPPFVLAGGGKSRPSPPHTPLHAPRLTFHRRAAPETDGVLRETEVDQQYAGQKWPCMYCIYEKIINFCHSNFRIKKFTYFII